eukprot:2454320-Rhodomonas_salina.2
MKIQRGKRESGSCSLQVAVTVSGTRRNQREETETPVQVVLQPPFPRFDLWARGVLSKERKV